MQQFLKNTKFVVGILQIHVKTLERHERKTSSSRNFLSTSSRDGLLTKVFGISPKLATTQLLIFPQPCFSKMAAGDLGSG